MLRHLISPGENLLKNVGTKLVKKLDISRGGGKKDEFRTFFALFEPTPVQNRRISIFVRMISFVNIQAQREAYREELEKAEKAVLDSGSFIGGPEVAGLEAELSAYTGTKAVTCASGTDALTIALSALGVQPGDEVVVPDFTFIAPAECVARLGATPVFADIDPQTLQVSAENAEALIGPKTRGIIAVNLFGQCAPYAELRQIAQNHGLWLLEDSAQAFGATQNGKQACTFGDMAITSFYPSKPLGCYGDGGAIFTANKELAQKARMLANHGSEERYLHKVVGMNSRLDALQAAILRVKLAHLDAELKTRKTIAERYNAFFANIEGVSPQQIAEGNTSTYAQYTLLVDKRKDFVAALDKAGIPHCIHYPMSLHRQPCFAELAARYAENVADMASQKAVSLPMCAFTPIDEIIERLEKVF